MRGNLGPCIELVSFNRTIFHDTIYPYITRKSSFAIVCNNLNAKTINAHGISCDSTVKRGSLCRYASVVNGKYASIECLFVCFDDKSPPPIHTVLSKFYTRIWNTREFNSISLCVCVGYVGLIKCEFGFYSIFRQMLIVAWQYVHSLVVVLQRALR